MVLSLAPVLRSFQIDFEQKYRQSSYQNQILQLLANYRPNSTTHRRQFFLFILQLTLPRRVNSLLRDKPTKTLSEMIGDDSFQWVLV